MSIKNIKGRFIMNNRIRKIMSILLIMSSLWSLWAFSFAAVAPNKHTQILQSIDVYSDNLYPIIPWADTDLKADYFQGLIDDGFKKGYLSKPAYDRLNLQLKDYLAVLEETLIYFRDHPISDQIVTDLDLQRALKTFNKNYLIQTDGRMFKEGNQVYLCYNELHLEALIQLTLYGILNEEDGFYDLNGIPTRADGIIMAVKLDGGEKEALSGQLNCPYKGLPEKARDYVAYAIKAGILEPVEEGTLWDNSPLTQNEMRYFLGKLLKQQEDIPSIDSRLGTYYDYNSRGYLLEAGEPFRNSDLVSLANSVVWKNYFSSDEKIVDTLISKGVMSKEIADYRNILLYTHSFGGGKKTSFENFLQVLEDKYEAFEFSMNRHDDKNHDGIDDYGSFYNFKIWGLHKNISIDEIEKIFKEFLLPLGASEGQADAFFKEIMDKSKYEYDKDPNNPYIHYKEYGPNLYIRSNDISLKCYYDINDSEPSSHGIIMRIYKGKL